MNSIVFENVSKSYGNVEVIKDFNLEIKEGERLILLGPSGCGKTTILRMIAGLESISSGNLYMNDAVVNHVVPGLRNIAMVFQNYALYPHMTVEENILFGLQVQKLPKQEQEERLVWAVDILGLAHLRKRYPRELSGGQRQRVALCRALVKKAPFFLLDEPLSNLDAQLRTLARGELVKVHEVYRPTFVYVTHDQIEAMTIGQKIVVINESKIQQYDTPDNIYNRPANVFVAKFIGSPSMNVVEVEVENDCVVINDTKIIIPEEWIALIGNRKRVQLGIRPEDIQISDSACPMHVDYIENHGNKLCIAFRLNNIVAMATTDVSTCVNKNSNMELNWNKVHVFDCETTQNIGYPENRKLTDTHPYQYKVEEIPDGSEY